MEEAEEMRETRKCAGALWQRWAVVFFLSMSLLFVAGAEAASLLDITAASDWEVRGTAAFSANGAIVGDAIGYDSRNQDHDGNYENSGRAGSRIDYDFIISKALLAPPATIEWEGCLPVTHYGYNMFGLGKLYNGGIFRQAVFQTRWENKTAIQAWSTGSSSYLDGEAPSADRFCATYRLEWGEDGRVTFYYNNRQVFESTDTFSAPLVFFVRTFEKPASVSSLDATSAAVVPTMEPCTADITSGPVPLEVTVTSRAAGVGPLSWSWDWEGDGTVDETTQVDHATHSYDIPGTYQAIVTVTDTLGQQAHKSLDIVALAPDTSALHGSLGGVFNGTVQMPDGTTRPVSGNVSGSWNSDMDDAGNVAAAAHGIFGADGIRGAFDLSYDSASGRLTGSWGDVEDEILSRPLTFVMMPGDGIRFRAPVQGLMPTSDGGLPFTGQVELELLGVPDTEVRGSVAGAFTADISYHASGSVTIPVLGQNQEVPVDLTGTVPTAGQVTGIWSASFAGGVATGAAAGDFSGSIDTSVSTPLGPYPISIPYGGTWQGTLGFSGQTISFDGNWLEPNIRAMGNADASFGGAFGIRLDSSAVAWPLPVTFSVPTSGGTYVDPGSGLTVHWELHNLTGSGQLTMK